MLIRKFIPPIFVLHYISQITSQMYNTSLQVKVVLKNCTLLQVESKTIYSSKVTK